MGPRRNADYLHDVSCAHPGRLYILERRTPESHLSVLGHQQRGVRRRCHDAVSNRQEAREMIERHCGGLYRIVGGSGGVLMPSAFDRV